MAAVGQIIWFFLWVAIVLLLARFVLDWVQLLARSWGPPRWVAAVWEARYAITHPPRRAETRLSLSKAAARSTT